MEDYDSALRPYEGKQFRVTEDGIDEPLDGRLTRGTAGFYGISGSWSSLILMPGHPAQIEHGATG